MDNMNDLMNQLANNPQMAAQLVQMLQQNGIMPVNQSQARPPMNWNMPTNPMASVWWNNTNASMNNMNGQNNQQPTQNQNQPQSPNTPSQQTENMVSSVRVIKSQKDILPDEIPMNGSISLFLQDDLNVVYGKRWTNDGTVDNMRFVLEMNSDQNHMDMNTSQSNNPNFDIEGLMNEIVKLIDTKLEQFRKDHLFTKDDNDSNTSTNVNENNKKGGERNGK